jgi:hypothetical protein
MGNSPSGRGQVGGFRLEAELEIEAGAGWAPRWGGGAPGVGRLCALLCQNLESQLETNPKRPKPA